VPIGSRSSSRPVAHGGAPQLIERLTRFEAGRHWVISCYLKLEPRDRARGKYLIKLKNRVRERLAWLEQQAVDRATRDEVAQDLTRVREYLEHSGNLPAGQGIALFACTPRKLFEAVPLPHVFRSRLAVDRTPLVRELAAVRDEFGVVLCAAYDRAGARLFRVTAFDIEELPSLSAGSTTRAGRFHGVRVPARAGSGFAASGEHNFNQRIRVEKHRHYAQIAQRLFELVHAEPVRGIVLAGIGRGEVDAVRAHLHPYVARLVLGSARINPKTAHDAEILAAILDVRGSADRQEQLDRVASMRDSLATGWAANGIPATLDALARGQVRTLLVDGADARPGWRCNSSGRLAIDAEGCLDEGPVTPVPDVLDEAIEDALRQHCHVSVIEDGAARDAVDGLGALFRFR